MALTDKLIHRALIVLILICLAVTVTGSSLFAMFADFLAQFPTDGF